MVFHTNRRLRPFFVSLLVLYVALFALGAFMRADWVVDAAVAAGLLVLFYSMSFWLFAGMVEFIMFNFALLMHVAGALGLYPVRIGFLAYDNFMHFTAMFVVAYLGFNFISRKLHVVRHKVVRRTVVDEHKLIFIFLVLATVAMLGTIVEIVEFAGFVFGQGGVGILTPSDGASGLSRRFSDPYVDTLEDIFTNFLGGIAGVLLFYNLKYKKDCWVC